MYLPPTLLIYYKVEMSVCLYISIYIYISTCMYNPRVAAFPTFVFTFQTGS